MVPQLNTITIAYGHGLSVTPLQLATATLPLVNGGFAVTPTFLPRSRLAGLRQAPSVVKPATSQAMLQLMRLNVLKGTGKRAEAEGRAYRYSGAGRAIDPGESDRRARSGERHVVRLKMPAEAIVLSCFRPVDPQRNRVVYEAGNFPSVRYLYQAQPDLEVVVCEDDEAVAAAIDERTLLVPISHVLFKTGEIQDVEAIVVAGREHGALVVLDAYQSAGVLPLDVTALDVDFAVGGSVKWLCGGPGAAWLYVRPELAATLDDFIVRRRGDIDGILADYGVPRVEEE